MSLTVIKSTVCVLCRELRKNNKSALRGAFVIGLDALAVLVGVFAVEVFDLLAHFLECFF